MIELSLKKGDEQMTTQEPKRKRDLGIVTYNSDRRVISFNTYADVVEGLDKFGLIFGRGEEYTLYVDGRYDFKDVLDYMFSLAGDNLDPTQPVDKAKAQEDEE